MDVLAFSKKQGKEGQGNDGVTATDFIFVGVDYDDRYRYQSRLQFFELSADRKRGQRKGATSKNVEKCQKYFRLCSTCFYLAGQKTPKIVKKCQKYFRHRDVFFSPFMSLISREKLCVNLEKSAPKIHFFSPLVFHRLRLLDFCAFSFLFQGF